MTARFQYLRAAAEPGTTSAKGWARALEAVAAGAVPKGAGVDLWDRMKEHLDEPARVVSLLGIPGAADIAVTATGGLRVGALATVTDVAEHAEVVRRYPALARAAGSLATPAIRNAATIGGNLAQRPRCAYFRSALHPCIRKGGTSCPATTGDHRLHAVFENAPCAAVLPSSLAAALTAYEATVSVASVTGARSVAVEELFVPTKEDPRRELRLAPGELITAVELPARPVGERSAYVKARPRESFDWPIVEAAVAVVVDGAAVRSARVVLGAVAMTPWRARASERALVGAPLSAESIGRAAAAAIEGATPLSGNRYKLALVRAMVTRALEEVRDGRA